MACAAPPLPPAIAADLDDCRWFRNTVGEAGAAVYRLEAAADCSDLYLKHGRGPIADDVADEMARLRWLGMHLPVPRVRYFALARDEAWLLSEALTGKTAYQRLESEPAGRVAIVDALAGFLRSLHDIPVESCPFNSDHRLRLAKARERMEAGLVETDDFDDERLGWTAEQVWAEMSGLLPFLPDPVVTHGDYSLDNLLFYDGGVSGCIDLGRVGTADRYQDLAIAWNCLGEFDDTLQDRFLSTYGIKDVDMRKLRFHLLLDEFF